jgi:hypothetical protein
MVVADAGRFLALATVPLAAALDVLVIGHLYAVAIATSAMSVFFGVAYEAHLPSLVGRERLVEGNAKMAAAFSVVEIASFGVAGWLVEWLSAPGALLIDAVSFLASAFFLLRIRAPEPPPPPVHERQHAFREAWAGVRVVAASAVLRTLAVVGMLLEVASAMIGVLFLVYLSEEVGFNPGTLGLIFGVGGLSSLFGAWLVARERSNAMLGPSLVLSLFVRGLGQVFMPLASSVSGTSVAFLVGNQVVTDPAWTYYEIHEVSLRQSVTPDEALGRMNATMRFAGFGAALAGTGLAIGLGEWLGARETLFVAVGITFAAAGVMLASPVAGMRRSPGRAVEAPAEA